jgi:hypothetical protein
MSLLGVKQTRIFVPQVCLRPKVDCNGNNHQFLVSKKQETLEVICQLGTLITIADARRGNYFSQSIDGMARVRSRFPSISKRPFVPLTNEEFESLKEVSIRPMRRTIPDEHRDRLIAAGYIRELVPNLGGVSALALTGAGIRRLEAGK